MTKYNETTGVITADVYKYNMARWDKKQYDLKPGEPVGRLEKMAPVVDSGGITVPLPDVDFSTGMTILDVETISEFRAGTLQTYPQVIYASADNIIRRQAAKGAYRPKSLQKKYNEIEAYMRAQPTVPVAYTPSQQNYSAPSGPSTPTYSPGSGRGEE